MHKHLAGFLLLATLCMASPPVVASPAFDAMLRQAELIRSSDHKQFESLIGQLDATSARPAPHRSNSLPI